MMANIDVHKPEKSIAPATVWGISIGATRGGTELEQVAEFLHARPEDQWFHEDEHGV